MALQKYLRSPVGGSSASLIPLVMGDGNTLFTATDGLNGITGVAAVLAASAITGANVPSANPASLTGNSLTSGLGVARRLDTLALVWVATYVNDGTNTISDLVESIAKGQTILSGQQVAVEYSGGGGATTLVYLPRYISGGQG